MTIDPTWSPALKRIHKKVKQMDELRAAHARVAGEVDQLVAEAVDEGERYRDIGKAAGRSVPWVQTVLRRLGVTGPRVRRMTARVTEAKRLAAADKAKADDLDDLMP